jgi:FkbM family methyltransferase
MREHPLAGLQWVENALSRLLSNLVPTMCMVDVGAHHGSSLEPFLDAGWSIYAFEPIESNRTQLTARFAGRKKLVIRSEAVSYETATKAFHLALNLDGSLHEYHHSLEHIANDRWHRKGPTIAIPAVSLDDLVSHGELPRQVGFLKIDTEGHDLAVLKGASQLACDVISVEFWGDSHALGKSPSPPDEVIKLLAGRGYDSFIVICHDGDATSVSYSSLLGTRTDSWGNIIFFNNSKDNLYRCVLEHREWLFVLEISGECDRLRSQLREKETLIQSLDAAARSYLATAEERLTVIEKLDAAARSYLATAEERLTVIKKLCQELTRGRADTWTQKTKRLPAKVLRVMTKVF